MGVAVSKNKEMLMQQTKSDFEHTVLKMLNDLDNRLWSIETELCKLWGEHELRQEHIAKIEKLKKEGEFTHYKTINDLRAEIEQE